MKTKILVTGANGFLGSHLIKELVKRHGIFIYGTYRKKTGRLLKKNQSNLINLRCDLSREKKVLAIFRKYRFDLVIHTAASISTKNDFRYLVEALSDNVMSQINLTSAAIKYNCKRFIYCSSISVYNYRLRQKDAGYTENDMLQPCTIYGWSKYVAERILKIATQNQAAMKGIVLRMSGIHGSNRKNGVISAIVDAALAQKTIYISEPKSRFRFLFVNDAVQAILLALFKEPTESYTCYNIAGEEVVILEELTQTIFHIIGDSCRVNRNTKGKIRNQVLNIDKIKRDLGFSPNTLYENLVETINARKRRKKTN